MDKLVYLVEGKVQPKKTIPNEEEWEGETEEKEIKVILEDDFELLKFLRDNQFKKFTVLCTTQHEEDNEDLIRELQEAYRVFENINSHLIDVKDYLDSALYDLDDAIENSDDGMSNLEDY